MDSLSGLQLFSFLLDGFISPFGKFDIFKVGFCLFFFSHFYIFHILTS